MRTLLLPSGVEDLKRKPVRGTGGKPRRTTVGCLAKSKAVALYREGVNLLAIARQAGVSRERVRQVLEKAGYTSQTACIRQLREAKRHQRRQELAERQAEKRAKKQQLVAQQVAQWSALWRSGLTVKQMAERLGRSVNAVTGKINHFRRTEAAKLFPKRLIDYDTLPIPSELRRLWASGESIEAISQRYSTSYYQVRNWLARARSQYGLAAFPHRFQRRDEHSQRLDESDQQYLRRLQTLLRPLKAGWAAFEPHKELAQRIGVSATRVYSLIVVARERLGWFAKRGSTERTKDLQQRMRRELAPAQRLWQSGMIAPKIAAALGITRKQLWVKICNARDILGESWFARRQLSTDDYQAKLKRISQLWKRGLSTQDISKQMGMKRKSLGCKIYNHRCRFGDTLFPRRKARNGNAEVER